MIKNIKTSGLLMVTLVTLSLAQPRPAPTPEEKQISRGKYLVEKVGICQDCHSPRDTKGNFDKTQWLAGSPLSFKPVMPIPGWRDTAPPIAGLEGWKTEDAIKLLSTGEAPNGKPPDPPMPAYRMNKADAAAVVAYLQSLKK
jgi:mono/diheme cytochrome c family protein